MQLVRPVAVESASGYMAPASFIGPAIYTEKNKFQKFEFKDLDKGKADYDKHADDGWVAMVQHYFTTAWLHNAAGPREFFVKKTTTTATLDEGSARAIALAFAQRQAPGR